MADAGTIQPAFWFYSIFFILGVGLSVFAILALRHGWRGRKRIAAFAIVWLGLTSYISAIDALDVLSIRQKLAASDVITVEGCPSYFHPGLQYGSKTMVGDERWSIAGYEFSYGAGEIRPGYHVTEPNGGVVHRDTRLRVSFVISPHYGRAEIVRLIVASHACPPAPDKPTI